jgi:hypothetical protein
MHGRAGHPAGPNARTDVRVLDEPASDGQRDRSRRTQTGPCRRPRPRRTTRGAPQAANPHIWRQQERLIPVTANEVLSHPGMVLNCPEDTVITRQPLAEPLVRPPSSRRSLSEQRARGRSSAAWRHRRNWLTRRAVNSIARRRVWSGAARSGRPTPLSGHGGSEIREWRRARPSPPQASRELLACAASRSGSDFR